MSAVMNSNFDNGMQMNQFSQERFIPLSFILEGAIQRTYHDLDLMINMFPSKEDRERKIKIVSFACKTRLLFMRIYALVKFLKSAHINVSKILSFLDQQSFIFVDTADFLYHLSKERLINARLPSFSISTAVDVLNLGSYNRLPTCIKGRILPAEKITSSEKETTFKYLNRIIQCRLALSELPYQLKNFKIDKGCVLFTVKNEFEFKLTLYNDNFKNPWRLISMNFLIKDAQDPNRSLIHILNIQNIIQHRLNANVRPLTDVYKCLHFFAQSIQLEILFQQMTNLNRINGGKFYRICEYVSWKSLTVKYWLEYSKNQYDYKITIFIGENSDYLQTNHYPILNWRDHKNIDDILKKDELLIEKILHHIIKYRSINRLKEIQDHFSKIKFCKATLVESKPAIKVQFFNSKIKSECVWVSIDYYTGLFKVMILNSASDFNLKTQIEDCINTDLKKLEYYLQQLRLWLIMKRLKLSACLFGFKSYESLYITHYLNNDLANEYGKLEKKRIFIELSKHENYIVMITFRIKNDLNTSSDDVDWYDNMELLENENNIKLDIYLLYFEKCKYDGELDHTKPFLKLISITQFNKLFSNKNYENEKLAITHSDKFSREHLALLKSTKSNELLDYNGNIIIILVNKLLYIEEMLPFISFTENLNKQQIVTQNLKKNPSFLDLNILSLLSEPKLDSPNKHLVKISSHLWSQLVSCCIRQKQHKDYSVASYVTTYFYKMPSSALAARFLSSIEFNFDVKILNDNSFFLTLDKHMNSTIELKSLDSFYETIKNEWYSMCQMFKLLYEIQQEIIKFPQFKTRIQLKTIDLKKLIISYGPKHLFKIQLEWNKENKQYEITLGVNKSVAKQQFKKYEIINPHILFINEIKQFFYKNQSIVVLVHLLNKTCMFAYALKRLLNLPKINAKFVLNQSFLAFSNFMLIVYALNHVRLTYNSKYWIDIQMNLKTNVLTLRDAYFEVLDTKKEAEHLSLMRFLNEFFSFFLDQEYQMNQNENEFDSSDCKTSESLQTIKELDWMENLKQFDMFAEYEKEEQANALIKVNLKKNGTLDEKHKQDEKYDYSYDNEVKYNANTTSNNNIDSNNDVNGIYQNGTSTDIKMENINENKKYNAYQTDNFYDSTNTPNYENNNSNNNNSNKNCNPNSNFNNMNNGNYDNYNSCFDNFAFNDNNGMSMSNDNPAPSQIDYPMSKEGKDLNENTKDMIEDSNLRDTDILMSNDDNKAIFEMISYDNMNSNDNTNMLMNEANTTNQDAFNNGDNITSNHTNVDININDDLNNCNYHF